MSRAAAHFATGMLLAAAALSGCDNTRKSECKDMLSATQPIEESTPTSAAVVRVEKNLDPTRLEDKPLSEYASSMKTTLSILQSTLELKEGPSPPDGTDDAIKNKLKAARTIRADITKYCGP